MTCRRSLLLAGLAGPLFLPGARAQQRKSLADPLRLGVDVALVESGLARSLQRSFGRDTGLAVQPVPGPALPLLEALERGELDAAITNTSDAELRLANQGLVHDRRPVAVGGLVLVGPAPKGRVSDPAGVAGSRDAASALQQIAAAAAVPSTLRFLSAADGSGAHVAEQALWRAAKVAPAAPWYAQAGKTGSLAAQARETGAYALVERGSWAALGGAPLAMLVDGDPLLDMPVHVMRSFRISHPAAKFFIGWITGPKGARVVAGHRGYRAPKR